MTPHGTPKTTKMTIPHLMNCEHQPDGRCAECAKKFPVLSVGDIVTTRFLNRWGAKCAGQITAVHNSTADVLVWNLLGPGGDHEIRAIPLAELNT